MILLNIVGVLEEAADRAAVWAALTSSFPLERRADDENTERAGVWHTTAEDTSLQPTLPRNIAVATQRPTTIPNNIVQGSLFFIPKKSERLEPGGPWIWSGDHFSNLI
eukprot:scpid91305/ scgid10974/ 